MDAKSEIEALITGMLFAIDVVDWDRIRAAFADEVLVDYTSLSGGSPERLQGDELMARWRSLLPGFDHTHHLTGPIILTSLDDRRAVAETHVRGYHYLDAPDRCWLVAGHYVMSVAKQGSHWLIAGVRLDVYRIEGDTSLPVLAGERAKTHPRIFAVR
jgi:hypothetical protein